MESRRTPAILAVLAVVLAVALFFVLRDGEPADQAASTRAESGGGSSGSDEPDDERQGDGAGSRGGDGGKDRPGGGNGGKPPPEEPPAAGPVVEIKGGQPVGGVQELSFLAGERILLEVRSDAPAHVHLHGYDVFMDVPADGSATFDVPATIEGVFELEIETSATQLAEITVQPG